jgi:Outer membrane protein beta-barrel domain
MVSGRALWSRTAISVALAFILCGMWLAPALAENTAFTEEFDRTGVPYFYMMYQYVREAVPATWASATDSAFGFTMDGANMWGIGLGYCITDKIGLRFETTMGNTEFYGTGYQTGLVRDVFLNQGLFALDFNLLDKRFTPYLSGGIGWQYLEAALTNVPPVPGYCWWDPWWGYICSGPSYPVYTDTQFVYDFGVGFRWDAPANCFLKVSGDVSWLKYPSADNYTRQGKFGVTFGVNY